MYRHLKDVHKSKEPYVCKQCQKRFESLKILNGHLAKHRAEKILAQEMAEEALENKVTYVCKFPSCGKYFNKVYQIKEHQQFHAKKISCEVWYKKFYSPEDLNQHLNSHLGIKRIINADSHLLLLREE